MQQEDIEPIQQPIPQPSAASEEITGLSFASTTKTIIDPEKICPICMENAKDIARDQLCLTDCCKKFICKNDARTLQDNAFNNWQQLNNPDTRAAFLRQHGGWRESELDTAKCPLCRTKNFTISNAQLKRTIVTNPLTIIMSSGHKEVLNPDDASILAECITIKDHLSDCPDMPLDFSNVPLQKPLTVDKLAFLLDWINDPERMDRIFDGDSVQVIEILKDHLEIANFLHAPEHVLYHLSNRIWPHIQLDATDTQEQKTEKLRMQAFAKPHLSSPAHLLQWLKMKSSNLNESQKYLFNHKFVDTEGFNLSYENIQEITRALDQWFIGHDGCYYNAGFRFGSLNDLKELIDFIGSDSQRIDLSGHALQDFSLAAIHSLCPKADHIADIINMLSGNNQGFWEIKLNNNFITKLSPNQFDYDPSTWCTIELQGNRIQSIDENIFALLKQWRAHSKKITIDISNNNLSELQKKEITNKAYYATHTIAERYPSLRKYTDIFGFGAMAIGSLGTAALSTYLTNKMLANRSMWIKVPTLLAVGKFGFGLGLIGGVLSFMGFDKGIQSIEQKLAGITHPGVRESRTKETSKIIV